MPIPLMQLAPPGNAKIGKIQNRSHDENSHQGLMRLRAYHPDKVLKEKMWQNGFPANVPTRNIRKEGGKRLMLHRASGSFPCTRLCTPRPPGGGFGASLAGNGPAAWRREGQRPLPGDPASSQPLGRPANGARRRSKTFACRPFVASRRLQNSSLNGKSKVA